jgi:hypothetical protein
MILRRRAVIKPSPKTGATSLAGKKGLSAGGHQPLTIRTGMLLPLWSTP